MIFRLFKPRPELQHFVSRIMINRFQLDPSEPTPTNPFPPQPEHCLYFYPYNRIVCRHYGNNSVASVPHSILVGPQLSRVDLTMGYDMLVILVGFQPGGMHRLLRIPMNELLDMPIDSYLLLGREIEEVTEQLNGAPDLPMMVEIIEQYLLKKVKGLKSMLPVEELLMQMLQQKNLVNVDQLAKQACVSIRQLERQFKERTGMPPKLFTRLVRFSKAWVMREKNKDISWLKIAHACDYADQMHMIRDFKDFVGVTPGTLQTSLEQSSLRLQASSFD
ncbi:MAG TPA: helix-turn-helix domain-containing protein [Chitinophagaceae bacterium]|nr:helix-turn-helix domain-containing protein [Chitinophagaceae bacterium]